MKPASSRATAQVTIEFGGGTFDCQLMAGLDPRGDSITRKQFAPDGRPVGNGAVILEVDEKGNTKQTDELIDRKDIVKKVATESGHFVFIDDAEIENLFNIEPNTLKITAFLPVALFGYPLVGKKLMFLTPGKKKVGKTNKVNQPWARMLSMMLAAMQSEQVFAIGEWTTRGSPVPVAIMPDGKVWTLHFDNELRERPDIDLPEPDERSIGIGRAVISQMITDQVPVLVDNYSLTIQAFAEEKAAAGDFDEPVIPQQATKADKDDDDYEQMLAMLSASLETAKQQAS